jgi:hypothetical protein
MKRIALILLTLCLVAAVFAGFKVKNVKAKKPNQFQSSVTVAGVTYGADLLLDGKDQKLYFYKELTPSSIIAIRLAVFNNGNDEVILPVEGLQLLAPDGSVLPMLEPQKVAQAVVGGTAIDNQAKHQMPQAQVGVSNRDPRTDPSDPRYDPRLDPNSPQYDPRMDPNSPRYDPSDPRNRGQYPPGTNTGGTTPGSYPRSTNPPGSYPPGSYPPGTYPTGGRQGIPGVVLNPGGGSGEDLSQFERQLAGKDFSDKAHTSDPIERSTTRDRFLYFPLPSKPTAGKGYTLRLPVGKGIPQEVVLKF